MRSSPSISVPNPRPAANPPTYADASQTVSAADYKPIVPLAVSTTPFGLQRAKTTGQRSLIGG